MGISKKAIAGSGVDRRNLISKCRLSAPRSATCSISTTGTFASTSPQIEPLVEPLKAHLVALEGGIDTFVTYDAEHRGVARSCGYSAPRPYDFSGTEASDAEWKHVESQQEAARHRQPVPCRGPETNPVPHVAKIS
jgi:hypothetical protein